MKLLLHLISLTALALAFPLAAAAQNPTVSQQITITYPIPQLGTCRDAKECFFYCEIPAHQPACQQYARQHGLNQVLGVASVSSGLAGSGSAGFAGLEFPLAELDNCASPLACRSFCQQTIHKPACRAFALRHRLPLVQRPQITFPIPELGNCANPLACELYCQNQLNPQAAPACARFAQRYKITLQPKLNSLLESASGELGCSDLLQCRQLCHQPENLNVCRKFLLRHLQSPSPAFTP